MIEKAMMNSDGAMVLVVSYKPSVWVADEVEFEEEFYLDAFISMNSLVDGLAKRRIKDWTIHNREPYRTFRHYLIIKNPPFFVDIASSLEYKGLYLRVLEQTDAEIKRKYQHELIQYELMMKKKRELEKENRIKSEMDYLCSLLKRYGIKEEDTISVALGKIENTKG